MSLKNAWLGLTGKLPATIWRELEVVREVRVEIEVPAPSVVEEVTLFNVGTRHYTYLRDDRALELLGKHFHSCAEAFAAIGDTHGLVVDSVPAYQVSERYFRKGSELDLYVKPKVAKGRK